MIDKNKIQELYDSGMSMKKISTELEISYKEVREIINKKKNLEFLEETASEVSEEANIRIPRKKALEIFEKKKMGSSSPGISAIVR